MFVLASFTFERFGLLSGLLQIMTKIAFAKELWTFHQNSFAGPYHRGLVSISCVKKFAMQTHRAGGFFTHELYPMHSHYGIMGAISVFEDITESPKQLNVNLAIPSTSNSGLSLQ